MESYVEYEIKVNETCWTVSNYDEVQCLWTFFPELVFRAIYKGQDITGEVLSMMRTEYIYG